MFDVDKFIMEVQARPILWQGPNKSFNDRVKKKTAWENLALGMYDDWNELSEERQNEIVHELQRKWRNLRDHHMKSKKKDWKRKAAYLAPLHFLDLPWQNNSSDDIANKKTHVDTNDDEEVDDSDDQISNLSLILDDSKDPQPSISAAPEPNTISNLSSSIEDPDRSFLISMLPHIKTMNEEQKVKFKLGTIRLIDEIKFNRTVTQADCQDPLLIQVKHEKSDKFNEDTTSLL